MPKYFNGLFLMLLLVASVPACVPNGKDSEDSSTVDVGHRNDQEAMPNANGKRSTTEVASGERHVGDWFEDVTAETDVEFTYRSGKESGHYYILEGMGGGVAMIDYDLDDDLDLFFTGGGTISDSPTGIRGLPSALFRNEGNWHFVNVTEGAGLSRAGDYSHGCLVADFNQDRYPDLFVCGYGGCQLQMNLQDGRFQDVSEAANLNLTGWNIAAAAGDIDHDGWPDLFVVRYLKWDPQIDRTWHNDFGQREVVGPTFYDGVQCALLRNCGDGTFEDITQEAGLSKVSKGVGCVITDLNGDGWLDIYVTNDEMPNQLYWGGSEFPLREAGVEAGVATDEFGNAEGSMGVDAGDYDGDGLLDLWVTNFRDEDNGLYRNLGGGTFLRSTSLVGLAGVSRRQVGWSTALVDLDSDGWLDIFVVNGHVSYNDPASPLRQPAQLFRNLNGRRFENVSMQSGAYFRGLHQGRGAAVGDLDNDGALDIVVSHLNEPVSLLRNRLAPAKFVRAHLRATRGDHAATGARVVASLAGRRLTRCLRSGAGYGSHFDQRITFPVVGDDPSDVTVHWPGRGIEKFANLKPGVTSELVEGEGEQCEGD